MTRRSGRDGKELPKGKTPQPKSRRTKDRDARARAEAAKAEAKEARMALPASNGNLASKPITKTGPKGPRRERPEVVGKKKKKTYKPKW